MGNLIVAQSGGPTAAINSTLAGVLRECYSNNIKVYGAKFGVEGILKENFIDLSGLSESDLDILSKTPASALGSCRYKLCEPKEDEGDFKRVIEVFRKHDIDKFIYIGGNDSMDTVLSLSEYFNEKGIDDMFVNGAPKTIDNDLCNIDHCPGFGSSAKFIATVCSELAREVKVYDKENVFVVEVMGRNAGWLAAAAGLVNDREIPFIIYPSEVELSAEKFLKDLNSAMQKSKNVIVVVSEGVIVNNLSNRENSEKDAFGHVNVAGSGKILESIIKEKLGYKTRYIELNLLQRCAAHVLSKTDIVESIELGRKAVQIGMDKKSGKMATLTRISNAPYKVEYSYVGVKNVANLEKRVPKNFINADENGVTEEMLLYLRPLIQGEMSCVYKDGLPEYFIF